jgi:hypothetical protein
VREGRAQTLAEVQQATTACTRCFGCRFEVEALLREELGERYVPTAVVTREPESRSLGGRLRVTLRNVRDRVAAAPPQKMYMPVLQGLGGRDVSTRLMLFNLHDERTERTAAGRTSGRRRSRRRARRCSTWGRCSTTARCPTAWGS